MSDNYKRRYRSGRFAKFMASSAFANSSGPCLALNASSANWSLSILTLFAGGRAVAWFAYSEQSRTRL